MDQQFATTATMQKCDTMADFIARSSHNTTLWHNCSHYTRNWLHNKTLFKTISHSIWDSQYNCRCNQPISIDIIEIRKKRAPEPIQSYPTTDYYVLVVTQFKSTTKSLTAISVPLSIKRNEPHSKWIKNVVGARILKNQLLHTKL